MKDLKQYPHSNPSVKSKMSSPRRSRSAKRDVSFEKCHQDLLILPMLLQLYWTFQAKPWEIWVSHKEVFWSRNLPGSGILQLLPNACDLHWCGPEAKKSAWEMSDSSNSLTQQDSTCSSAVCMQHCHNSETCHPCDQAGKQVFAIHAIRSLRPRSMGSPSPQRKFRRRRRRKRNGRLMLPMHLKLCFSMASRALGKLWRVSLRVIWIWVSPMDQNIYLEEIRVFQRWIERPALKRVLQVVATQWSPQRQRPIDTIGTFSLNFGCAHQMMAQMRGETYLPLLHTCFIATWHVRVTQLSTHAQDAQFEKYIFWYAFGSEKNSIGNCSEVCMSQVATSWNARALSDPLGYFSRLFLRDLIFDNFHVFYCTCIYVNHV